MTTFEALVSMSQTLLRARGEWHGPATSYDDMDQAANGCADLMNAGKCTDRFVFVSAGLVTMAVAELKRRAGYREPSLHLHDWVSTGDLIDRCTVCGEERA